MSLKIKNTEEGTTTVYHSELDETYHSVYGAVQEAEHVYINAGLKALPPQPTISILEIGFGTGLNALLSCEFATKQQQKIIYHTLEKYPLSAEILQQLNFGKERQNLLEKLHACKWEEKVEITPYFTILKTQTDLCSHPFSQQYNLIYYDAFAPDKQPEMWTPQLLKRVADTLTPNGILTTYSTKGTVKQAFRAAGLQVKRLPGPIGKRDMLRCTRTVAP